MASHSGSAHGFFNRKQVDERAGGLRKMARVAPRSGSCGRPVDHVDAQEVFADRERRPERRGDDDVLPGLFAVVDTTLPMAASESTGPSSNRCCRRRRRPSACPSRPSSPCCCRRRQLRVAVVVFAKRNAAPDPSMGGTASSSCPCLHRSSSTVLDRSDVVVPERSLDRRLPGPVLERGPEPVLKGEQPERLRQERPPRDRGPAVEELAGADGSPVPVAPAETFAWPERTLAPSSDGLGKGVGWCRLGLAIRDVASAAKSARNGRSISSGGAGPHCRAAETPASPTMRHVHRLVFITTRTRETPTCYALRTTCRVSEPDSRPRQPPR